MSSAAIVAGYPSPALEAGRQVALGRVLARPRATRRQPPVSCGAGIRGWREVGSPYEVARARGRPLARAPSGLEDEDDADLERAGSPRRVPAARRPGRDNDAVERELRDAEDRRSGPLTARKTFMFTDIVGSTTLAEALGNLAWEHLLRWHDDMLRNAGGPLGAGRSSTRQATASSRRSNRPALGIACSDLDPAAHWSTTGPPPASPSRCGSVCTRPKPTDVEPTTAGRVSTSPPGSPRWPLAARSSRLRRHSPTQGDVPVGDARLVTVKGVSEPVSLAAVVWE